jgi:chromate reductase, NAD(P)H dehydrogenase (quinone)
MNIVALCGSLRTGSINRTLALEVAKLADGFTIEFAEIGNLPLFNQDVETSAYPPEAAALKEKLAGADGILFFCPEFNRGMPGVLKNAIDWVSRPSGTHPFAGKSVGVLGASSGPRGTIVAQYDLKRMMNYFGAHVMGNPEFYVDNSDKKIDGGALRDEKTREYLQKYVDAFKAHVERPS